MWKWAVASGIFLKRLFDIFASLTFLILLSPLLTLIAILIKLEDRGPIIFAQRRVGKFGKEFKMFKFRSMRVDAEANGPVWAREGYSRVTRGPMDSQTAG